MPSDFLVVRLIIAGSNLSLIEGDITDQDTEAIVNAANSSLLGGGGVDGAIHRAGGPQIKEECMRIRESEWPDGLPPGKSVITHGGRLKAKYVIHTVGPVWKDGKHNESDVLRASYLSSLVLANQNRIGSIAFPSISTGAYGYHLAPASEIALITIRDYLASKNASLKEVRMVLFSDGNLAVYERTAEFVLAGYSP